MPSPRHSYVEWSHSGALMRRLTEIQNAARPGSKAVTACKADIRNIIVKDHEDKMLRSVDRYGRPLAPLRRGRALRPWEIRARGGSGPPLVPRGLLSRFVTNLEVTWTTIGGVSQLVMRFKDILSKKGKSFAEFHLSGPRFKAGSDWELPERNVAGITPKGWYQVIKRHKQLAADLIRSGGGR